MPTTTELRSGPDAPAFDGGPVLQCSGLRKHFGAVQAVRDVGFTIAEGETYGLLGPNGAGKTTAILMICGLLQPDAGTVRVAGSEMRTTSAAAKKAIGYVPQDLAIYPDLTARENLRFFGRLYGMTGRALRDRVDEVLEVVGLDERADTRSATFSGGMKRRLNIGIGLLHQPRLLVLDEPTVGVDPQSRNAILESVQRLSATGMAVLYTTHYMEEAQRLCDRVGIIDAGELKAEGTQRELVALVGERDRVELVARGNLETARARVEALDGIVSATTTPTGLTLLVEDARAHLPGILAAAGRADLTVTSVEVIEPDLEGVFLHLTGKALRD
jgi:ABC-2 type transport system ATP-binding protein